MTNTRTIPARTRQEYTGLNLFSFILSAGAKPTQLWTRLTDIEIAAAIDRGETIRVYLNSSDAAYDRPTRGAYLNSRNIVMVWEA